MSDRLEILRLQAEWYDLYGHNFPHTGETAAQDRRQPTGKEIEFRDESIYTVDELRDIHSHRFGQELRAKYHARLGIYA